MFQIQYVFEDHAQYEDFVFRAATVVPNVEVGPAYPVEDGLGEYCAWAFGNYDDLISIAVHDSSAIDTMVKVKVPKDYGLPLPKRAVSFEEVQ